jgi:hypothetical protein
MKGSRIKWECFDNEIVEYIYIYIYRMRYLVSRRGLEGGAEGTGAW